MPNIVSHVCIDNKIKCKYLKKYINNRQKYINDVKEFYNVTKDDAKQLFIMLTFNGSYSTWLKKYKTSWNDTIPFVVAYTVEMDKIASYIIENNQELYKYIIAKKSPQNPKASVYSYYTLENKNRILACIYLFLQKKKIINDNIVLSHDGFMIPK